METRIYSDLDLNFTKHPVTKDVARKTKENAVIASVKNILYTNYNERPFNPRFGSNIRGLLFEPVDSITATNLDKEIRVSLLNYEPRIKIDALQCNPNYDQNGYDVYLRFYILNSIRPITINVFLDRLR
jgi:phage baseplate assembly protein W